MQNRDMVREFSAAMTLQGHAVWSSDQLLSEVGNWGRRFLALVMLPKSEVARGSWGLARATLSVKALFSRLWAARVLTEGLMAATCQFPRETPRRVECARELAAAFSPGGF